MRLLSSTLLLNLQLKHNILKIIGLIDNVGNGDKPSIVTANVLGRSSVSVTLDICNSIHLRIYV